MIPILIGVTLLIFFLFTFFGEDPARVALGSHATPAKIESLRGKWGLDRPLIEQYMQFWREILTADFGRSFVSGEKLSTVFKQGALVSLSVTLPPFVMGTILNIAVAMIGVVPRWCARAIYVGHFYCLYERVVFGLCYFIAIFSCL